jgi:hypothetical protein
MQKLTQYPLFPADQRRFEDWMNRTRSALSTPGLPEEDERERKIAAGECAIEERAAYRQMAAVERNFKQDYERWQGVPLASGVKPHLTNPHAVGSRFAEAAILGVDAALGATMAVQLLDFPTWISATIGVAATAVVYKTAEFAIRELIVADQSKPKSALVELKRIFRAAGFIWAASIAALLLLPRFSHHIGNNFDLVLGTVLTVISFTSPILAAVIEVITTLRSAGNEHALVYAALQHRLDAIARLRSEFSMPAGNNSLLRGEDAA